MIADSNANMHFARHAEPFATAHLFILEQPLWCQINVSSKQWFIAKTLPYLRASHPYLISSSQTRLPLNLILFSLNYLITKCYDYPMLVNFKFSQAKFVLVFEITKLSLIVTLLCFFMSLPIIIIPSSRDFDLKHEFKARKTRGLFTSHMIR